MSKKNKNKNLGGTQMEFYDNKDSDDSIDLKEILQIIKKRQLMIIIVTLLSISVGIIFTFYISKPVYQAKTTIYVGKESGAQITQQDISLYQSLIDTYSQIAKSRKVAEVAVSNLNINITVDQLLGQTSVVPIKGTQIITVSARSGDPTDAANEARAMADAFIDEAMKIVPSGNAQIVDNAQIPKTPIKPNKKINISISFIMGIIVSFGLSLLLEFFNDTIKSENDVEKYLDTPLLGSIQKQNNNTSLVVERDPKSPVTESYKTLRTNILFSLSNRNIKTLLISSSNPKEGKTTTAANLAASVAQVGKRTLLIDCDLRKPWVHRCFNISNQLGLSDLLFDGKQIDEVISKINNKLDVLSAGRITYNPSELLSSQRMKSLLIEMENEYDYVILDTPPLIAFTDALTLAAERIGVVLVLSSEETKIQVCQKAKQLLQNVNASLIGVVLNKVNEKSIVGYGYDYYSYNESGKHKKKGKEKKNKYNNLKQPKSLNV